MHKLDTIDDKLKLLNSIADTLAEHDNAIEREVYARNYAEEYGISLESLLSEIKRKLKNKQRTADYSRSYDERKINVAAGRTKESDTRYGELERMLLVMLCHDNRFYSVISKSYGLASFRDEGAGNIARKLYGKLEENKECVLAELINGLSPGEAAYLIRLSETKCEFSEPEKAIRQVLNKLELMNLEDRQKETIELIKNEQDGARRQELGLEFSLRAEKIAELKRMA